MRICMDAYRIRDDCRKNLNKYTVRAFSIVPKIKYPIILDAGCGTGVPTLALIEICDGIIYALDSDESCLRRLKEKIAASGLNDRIKIVHGSILDPALLHDKFDIIMAEGLLNAVGFEKGLPALVRNSKNGGYLIIHDELKNDPAQRRSFEKNKLRILGSFPLNEDVWWNEYYACLERRIKNTRDAGLFEKELSEINEYKNSPHNFESIYYVLQNLNYAR